MMQESFIFFSLLMMQANHSLVQQGCYRCLPNTALGDESYVHTQVKHLEECPTARHLEECPAARWTASGHHSNVSPLIDIDRDEGMDL